MKLSTVAFLSFLTAASAETLLRKQIEPVDESFGEGDCSCRTDYDCQKKVCIFNGYTGTCGIEGSGGPAPTPAPVEPTDCCPEPKSVPTECEVLMLIDLLDIAVSGSHRLAPQWLRLAFHDAGTFNTASDEGGANGCLMNDPDFRLEPENAFLDLPINTLQGIKAAWEAQVDTCVEVSAADIIQFAGFFASVRQQGSFQGINTAKKNALLNFEWGRADEPNCEIHWVENLPGFSLGTSSGNIPLRCLNAGKEIKEKMMERNGFTAMESAALIGAHTIGKTRFSFGPSLSNPWVQNGGDNASTNGDGPIFDNAFHSFLENDIVANTAAAFGVNQAPFDVNFGDWFLENALGGLNHLDTDLALAFPTQDASVHPDFHTFTTQFAANNNFFIQTYFQALNKMSRLGVDEILSKPTDCTPCDEGSDISIIDVITLVSALGDAEAKSDEAIVTLQKSPEFAEKLELSTTEVTDAELLDKTQADAELQQEIKLLSMEGETREITKEEEFKRFNLN